MKLYSYIKLSNITKHKVIKCILCGKNSNYCFRGRFKGYIAFHNCDKIDPDLVSYSRYLEEEYVR